MGILDEVRDVITESWVASQEKGEDATPWQFAKALQEAGLLRNDGAHAYITEKWLAETEEFAEAEDLGLDAIKFLQARLKRFIKAFRPPVVEKHPNWPCATEDCPGDSRYNPPGRGHTEECSQRWLAVLRGTGRD